MVEQTDPTSFGETYSEPFRHDVEGVPQWARKHSGTDCGLGANRLALLHQAARGPPKQAIVRIISGFVKSPLAPRQTAPTVVINARRSTTK